MKKQQEPIRVAMIVGKWIGGGVEAVLMNYYRHIDHKKIQFDFICDDDSTCIPYEEIEKLGGKVILCPPYQKINKYIKTLKRIFKEGNYKIVHSNINALSMFPLYAAKKAGVPVRIAHSHSTSNKKEFKRHIIKNLLRPFSKVYATDYFACSELAGRWLFGDKTFNEGKVTIINNAIDVDKFKYNENVRNKKREELDIKKDTLVIGHIGRFVSVKNHSFVIDIFNEVHKKNSNSLLVLAGTGPLMEKIKEKVNDLGLTDSIMFLGQRNDVNELYQAFDIFLLPSLYEGLGMVLIEAQYAGLPCVVSTEVPKIAKITNNFEFVDLNFSSNEWADAVFNKYCIYNRFFDEKKIFYDSFNIKFEAVKLLDYYLNL